MHNEIDHYVTFFFIIRPMALNHVASRKAFVCILSVCLSVVQWHVHCPYISLTTAIAVF